jgi:hypothetical protein
MIWESHPWREELERIADRLDSWREGYDDEDERTSFEQERDVVLSAFILRKLIEAKKLSTELVAATVNTDAYPLIERVPDHMNWHRIEEFYDLDRPGRRTLTVEQLCNQFIHSFIFMVETSYDENDPPNTPVELRGFLVSSDRQRSSVLLRVPLNDYVKLLRRAAGEKVVATQMVRDELGQWVATNMSAEDLEGQDPTWRDRAVDLKPPLPPPT